MKLKGKIVDFLGDSITEGACVADINNRYDNRLKNILELKEVYNYGIGGSRIAYQTVPSECPRFDMCFCSRAYDMNKNADVIVVYGGINDWLHGDAPFGKEDDNTPATFCGAVECLLRILTEIYINSKIVFMTPAHTCMDGMSDKYPSTYYTKGKDARPLVDYVNVICEKCKKYGVPVLNLYNDLGIDANDEQQRTEFTAEGLHFNDKGHGVLADCLAKFLKSL